jgi:hypothetical protein
MEDYAGRARYYREQAEEAAIRVERMATEEAKRMMAAIARDFLQIAEMLEKLDARNSKI